MVIMHMKLFQKPILENVDSSDRLTAVCVTAFFLRLHLINVIPHFYYKQLRSAKAF